MSSCERCNTVTAAQAHCSSCHHTFGGLSAFERHRVGRVGATRCVEPSTLGLHQDQAGVWRTPMSKAAQAKLENR